jgi:hypothetical protein
VSDLIAALDDGLKGRGGEDFILRRVIGQGASVINVDVTCRGRIDGVSVTEIAAGIKATDLNVIFSPTQINEKRWPGGTVPIPPPFNVDPRVPRENGADKAIVRGKLCQITFVKTFWPNGELSRIEMRVSG